MRAKCQHLCKMPHIPHCSRCPPPPAPFSFSYCYSFAASLSRLSVVRLSPAVHSGQRFVYDKRNVGRCRWLRHNLLPQHTQYNLQRQRRRWLPQSRQLATCNWRPSSALTRAGPEKLHSEAALIWRECQPFSIL